MSRLKLFKYRHYQAEIILLCVRWYLRYSLSYRDLEEIMIERGLSVDHTTIYRWVQRYAPIFEKRCRARLRPTNNSWEVDETYLRHERRFSMSEWRLQRYKVIVNPNSRLVSKACSQVLRASLV